jgi:hypothetical protein
LGVVDLENFKILTSLEEFGKTEFATSTTKTLNGFQNLDRRTHRTRLDDAQKHPPQTNPRLEKVDVATDFLGLAVHLKVCRIGVFSEQFNGVRRQCLVTEDEEQTVFLEDIDLRYIREGVDSDWSRFGVGVGFAVRDVDSTVCSVCEFSSTIYHEYGARESSFTKGNSTIDFIVAHEIFLTDDDFGKDGTSLADKSLLRLDMLEPFPS